MQPITLLLPFSFGPNCLSFSGLVPLCQLDIDVPTSDGAGTMASVIPDMLPGTDLYILLYAGMTQPVHRAIHHRFGFLLQ